MAPRQERHCGARRRERFTSHPPHAIRWNLHHKVYLLSALRFLRGAPPDSRADRNRALASRRHLARSWPLAQAVVVNLRLLSREARVLGVTGHVCEVQLVLQQVLALLEVTEMRRDDARVLFE